MNLSITQIKSYFPKQSIEIKLPSGEVGTPRIETKKTLSDMALTVSQKLKLERFKDKKGVIIFASASISVDDQESTANRLQYELELSKEVVTLQLTGGCYISMQALEVGKSLMSSDPSMKFALVVTAEKFSCLVSEETKEQRQSSHMWSDGASAVIIENSNEGIKIDNYKVHTDGESWFDCKVVLGKDGKREWGFADTQSNLYYDDGKKALDVINDCLDAAKLKCSNLSGVVIINRSRGFAKKIMQNLECTSLPVYESFLEVGHAGCSDLLYNIEILIHKNPPKGKYLIYTCGYGYVRSASILTLK